MMDWKRFDRKRSWPNFKVLSWHSPGVAEENHENPLSGLLSCHMPVSPFILIRLAYVYAYWKVKKQSSPATRHDGAWEERRNSSYSFLTSAIDGGEWSASRPGRVFPRGKDFWYTLYSRLGGPQSRCGQREWRKNPLPLPGIEPRSPGHPVRSQTLYWLSYAGSILRGTYHILICPFVFCVRNSQ
jgi:hypothetical protein